MTRPPATYDFGLAKSSEVICRLLKTFKCVSIINSMDEKIRLKNYGNAKLQSYLFS